MRQINVMGIDLAKNVFQIHGNDERGKTVIRKQLKRRHLVEFIAQLPPCLIGMESCGGAHHWAREFEKLGHTVRLIAPQFIKPFVKSNKNDACDAEAIAEAVVRPNMRFVSIKQPWQQDIQILHRARQRLVKGKTALINELHGFLAEYGVALTRGETRMLKQLAELLSPESEILSPDAKESIQYLVDELHKIGEKVEFFDKKVSQIARRHEICRRLQSIPGVGVITATAILAAVSDSKLFQNGRQFQLG